MTQLYIVEGLPCSGKSTTAEFIADCLMQSGVNAVCIDEGSGNHPADYEFHAYVDDANLVRFQEPLSGRIKACSERVHGGYIVPLNLFGGEDFERLVQYKIYDSLPWEMERPLMLDKWRGFVRRADSDKTYVFNCILLQNPMCETMMRFGFSLEKSFAYISEIAQIIGPLKPAVVYLKNDDIAQSVKTAAKERGDWLEAVIRYHTGGEYGKRIGARGFEGYIACLAERQRRELAILERLPVRKLVLDHAHRDWEKAYQRIEMFLRA